MEGSPKPLTIRKTPLIAADFSRSFETLAYSPGENDRRGKAWILEIRGKESVGKL